MLRSLRRQATVPDVLQNITYNDKYVIEYDFSEVDHEKAIQELNDLLTDLESAGLHTEVRAGHDETLLVFTKAPAELLGNFVYKSRMTDWLHGITSDPPERTGEGIVYGDSEAEDILSMHHIVSWPKDLGGAGITPGHGQWEHVKSIFPLHNPATNKALLAQFSQKPLLRREDLDKIRNLFGTKVAFYFAFTQAYIISLSFPAIAGLLAWAFLPQYSLPFAICVVLWCTVFLEYWTVMQTDLSIRWKVNGVVNIKLNRPNFKFEKVITDAAGMKEHYYPRWKQILWQLVQFPFIIMALVTLGLLIFIVFALEVFISEAYDGQYKFYMEYVPTIILAAAIPFISQHLEGVAAVLTEHENHRTQDEHEMSLTQKVFVLNMITQYLPIFLTAFLYVPYGHILIPRLESILLRMLGKEAARKANSTFSSDPNRLRNEVIAITVAGQISHFGEELLWPYLRHSAGRWLRDYYRSTYSKEVSIRDIVYDYPEDLPILEAARHQATLPGYDVQDDFSQMVIQFGYLALFSPVWPLVPIGFLVSNWLELRSDFLKICIEHKRPAPTRMEGIGPWIHSMKFLTWVGSISTAAIVHQFGAPATGYEASWSTLPITIFVSEHVFLGLRAVVQMFLQNIGSTHIRQERHARYIRRKKAMDDIKTKRSSLAGLDTKQRERRKTMVMNGGEEFWKRQAEEGKSAEIAVGLMQTLRKARQEKTLVAKRLH